MEVANAENIKFDQQRIASQDKIATSISKQNNQLEIMALKNPAAYNSAEVQKYVIAQKEAQVALQNGTGTQAQMAKAIDNTSKAFDKATIATSSARSSTDDFTKSIEKDILKVTQWAIATALIYGTLRQISEGVQYIKDLNTEMTNIQIVTGKTSDEINRLALQYNSLAREMGVTTLEVSKGSLEWARQGKSVSDTNILIKDSMMMSKLANLDAAQATEYMTSILNGFQLKAQDMEDVLSKLVALDNAYASSVGEIADAMQRSSNSAMQAGVSLDDLAAYITVISATTRKSSESIGESLKTMFARFQNIKMGNLDEEGESINNVEEALKRVNIVLRDTPTTFRPLSDVISELANKWNSLSQVEQNNLAVQIAGVRQRENFLVLMNNYNQVIEAQAIELNSSGLALQRYEIYLDSVEAHANKFATAMEAMWQATINSDAIKSMYDFGTSIMDTITKAGGLIPIMQDIIAILIIFNAQLIITKGITLYSSFQAMELGLESFAMKMVRGSTIAEALNISLIGLNTTMAIGIPLLAALVVGFTAWQQISATQKAGLKQTSDAWTDMFSKIDGANNTATKTLDTFDQGLKNLNKTYNDLNPFLKIFINQQAITDQGLQQTIDIVGKVSKNWQDYSKSITIAAKAAGYEVDAEGKVYKIVNSRLGQTKVYINNIKTLTRAEYDFGNSAKDASIKMQEHILKMKAASGVTDIATGKTEDFVNALSDLQSLLSNKLGDALTDFKTKAKKLADSSAELKSRIKELSEQPITEGQQQQLFELRQQLAENDQAVADNANAYDMATKQIIYDMLLQKIAALSADETIDSATQQLIFGSVMKLGEAWGLVSQDSIIAAETMNNAMLAIRDGNVKGAISMIQVLYSNAMNAAGDYYITYHVDTTDTTGGRADAHARARASVGTIATPPGGWYSSGLGGGGGGGGSSGGSSSESEIQYSINSLLEMAISLIRRQKEAEKDLLEEKQKEIKAQQEAFENQQDALGVQLDTYRNIIDSRKEILRSEQEEEDYQNEINNKNKSISKIQQELAILALDNSQESKAKQLELQDELNSQISDLNETQRDHEYQEQENALDAEYALYEAYINNQIAALQAESDALQPSYDAIQAQIDAIDEWLSKSGLVAQAALQMIIDKAPDLYDALIEWNRTYGSGIDKDVTDAWKEAYKALKKYKDLLDSIKKSLGGTGGANNISGISSANSTTSYYSDLASDTINGLNTSTNEVFSKLIKEKLVLNSFDIKSMMSNIIPNIASNIRSNNMESNGNLVIGNLINVQGNVNKDTIPDIKKIADQVMDKFVTTLVKRGYIRNAQVVGL